MWHPYQYDPVLAMPAGQVVVQRTIRRIGPITSDIEGLLNGGSLR
jgi:hypothetical protein